MNQIGYMKVRIISVNFNRNKAGHFESSFFWGEVGGSIWPTSLPLQTSGRTDLISIKVLHLLSNVLRVGWKLTNTDITLYACAISFFVTRKCQKIRKIDKNS